MPDPYRSFNSGDPIPADAATYNAYAAAARLARDAGYRSELGQSLAGQRRCDLLRIKNGSGADRLRGSVLGIDSPIFNPASDLNAFLREPALVGITPGASHADTFAVLVEPIADGRVGWACVAGICLVQVDVQSSAHGYAQASSGVTSKLVTAGIGSAQILWRESGSSGVKWAVVRLGCPLGDRVGKITGSSIAAVSGTNESSGTVRLYNRSASGVRSDSGVDVTAWNPSNTSLPANAWVLVGKVDGLWTIRTRLDC